MAILPHVLGPFESHYLGRYYCPVNDLPTARVYGAVYKSRNKAMQAVINEVPKVLQEKVHTLVPNHKVDPPTARLCVQTCSDA